MRIVVPRHFRHPGELSSRYASDDPRATTFDDKEVTIDLRQCTFIRPAAVLWCLVYPLLAKLRGAGCVLLVPENVGVCVYLKSINLFDLLRTDGIDVDDRGIPDRPDAQIVLPLTAFANQAEVERLANEAYEALSNSGLGAPNLYPLVSEVFAELALNAVEHAHSPISAYGFIQFYEFEEGQRFTCGIADGGMGIRQSLARNPDLEARVPYDWVAIELAVRERISGTGEKTRGIGLYGVSEDMRKPGRQLMIHSGIGSLQVSETVESQARRATLFPGTLAYMSIPT